MFSVNGVPLDNTAMGWEVRSTSTPLPGVQFDRESTSERGRDGYLRSRGSSRPSNPKLVVHSPKDQISALMALVGSEGILTYTDAPGKSVVYETDSVAMTGYGPADAFVDVTFTVRYPGVYWRDTVDSTSTFLPAASGGAHLNLWAGLAAPVQDALVRLRGPLTNPQVIDVASGAFVAIDGTIPADRWVRFDMATVRAWETTTDTWTGGAEVTDSTDFGGPRDAFELTPFLPGTPPDPSLRTGRVQLLQQSFATGGGLNIRGRAAYPM